MHLKRSLDSGGNKTGNRPGAGRCGCELKTEGEITERCEEETRTEAAVTDGKERAGVSRQVGCGEEGEGRDSRFPLG